MNASRLPRRAFAAPLVMTIAAAPAACVVTSDPAPRNTGTTTTTTGGTPDTRDHREGQPDTVVIANPPPPKPEPEAQPEPPPPPPEPQAPPDHRRDWTVTLNADGTCAAFMDVKCVPNATCNPPPPQKVECPAGITADRPMQLYAMADSNECWIAPPSAKCPPKATCNPPPPRKHACPTW